MRDNKGRFIKGHKINKGNKNPMFGKIPWNKGKSIQTNDSLEKWRESGGIPWNKGKSCSEEIKIKIKKTLTGRRLSKKHKDSISKGMPKGRDHPSYIDGKGGRGYVRFGLCLKESVKERDNNCCQNCYLSREDHKKKYGMDIEVHHIDYDKTNSVIENLITLCKKCNIQANKNKDYWNEKFKKYINSKMSRWKQSTRNSS